MFPFQLWKINDKHITGNDLKDVTIKSALKEALDMEIGVSIISLKI